MSALVAVTSLDSKPTLNPTLNPVTLSGSPVPLPAGSACPVNINSQVPRTAPACSGSPVRAGVVRGWTSGLPLTVEHVQTQCNQTHVRMGHTVHRCPPAITSPLDLLQAVVPLRLQPPDSLLQGLDLGAGAAPEGLQLTPQLSHQGTGRLLKHTVGPSGPRRPIHQSPWYQGPVQPPRWVYRARP